MRGVCLSRANLRGADLRGVDLRDADLREANLDRANLSGAVLRNTDLRGACLDNAKLVAVDLEGAVLFSPTYAEILPDADDLAFDEATASSRRDERPDERPVTADVVRYPSGVNVLRKENGDYWLIRFADTDARLADRKGFVYVHHLIRHRGDWIPSVNLLALTDPESAMRERQRRQETRQRILDAQADARDALNFVRREGKIYPVEDRTAAERFYSDELRDVSQQIRSLNKNVYARVKNNIRRAFDDLAKPHAALVEHLTAAVRYRGGEWVYSPRSHMEVEWLLD
jgi:uncharacterized protein YjbI with pentapeptide repeats